MSRSLVFPGQGAQYVGIGVSLAEKHPAARDILDRADRALGFALSDIMANGPEADLTRTDRSQLAILTASMMAFAVVKQQFSNFGRTLAFTATAGLSLGEYTALVVAEALSFEDALGLVKVRGEAMQAAADAVAGGMVALVGPDEATATALCAAAAEGEVLVVANLNCPGQVVISGTKSACARAVAKAKEFNCRRAIPLSVAGAFHSPLMAPAAERLGAALAGVAFRDPKVPVYANVTAAPVVKAADLPGLLARQLTSPVRWADSVVRMQADGVTQIWELGPGKTLSGMVERTVKGLAVRNLDTAEDALRFADAVTAG
ncbi:malonyl CoA-acyl carrier protein transacylase [Planctomycetota bacterium]|nr:malonyl CoA-acyl carrier protein transacylase [Planctomycetota bacterium]